MSVQAKVRCIGNSPPQWDSAGTMRMARFTPVYDSDPSHPNFEWSQATWAEARKVAESTGSILTHLPLDGDYRR